MICSRRFVSLFKKCFSLVVGGVGFLKKKSDECNFHLNSPVEKKRKFFRIYEYSTVPRDQHTCAGRSTERFLVDTRCAYY